VIVIVNRWVNLHCVHTWFEAGSDLRVNLAKSWLILVGEVENISMLAGVFGCDIDSCLTSYLGLPLGATFKEKVICYPIIDKFE